MDVSMALGIAALVAVSAITPGPNNVAVMAAAARRGFLGALPAIGGIVLGSLVMVLLTTAGVGAALASVPVIGTLLAVVGCAYLGWLGLQMFNAAGSTAERATAMRAGHERDAVEADRPSSASGVRSDSRGGFRGLFLFQFLNPKGWTMVLTAVATAQSVESSLAGTAWVLGTFMIVPAACLSFWALSGALLSKQLARPMFRRRFDQLMGASLVICALLLLADTWQAGGAVWEVLR